MSFRILHVADLHITEKKIPEYQPIFEEFIVAVEASVKTRTTLVVMPGDIFDTKSTLKPLEILFLAWFVNSCLDKGATVVIMPGNHDCNMNNSAAMDLVSPIMKLIRRSNLHCFTETKMYPIEIVIKNQNILIDFYFYSPLDKTKMPGVPTDLTIFSIALVHEPVTKLYGTKLRLNVEHLAKNYNLVLMGDIHTHDVIHANIAYCGSLVQQNILEDPFDHGYIAWEVEPDFKIKHKYVRIVNPLGVQCQVICACDNYSITNAQEYKIDKFVKVQKYTVSHIDCSKEYVDKIRHMLTKTFGLAPFATYDKNVFESKTEEKVMTMDSITDWIAASNTTETQDVLAIHNEVTQQSKPNSGQWRPIYMEWSGMFGYPDTHQNHFNFNAVTPSFGITGANKAGKSGIFDIMIFLLWGVNNRGSGTECNRQSNGYSAKIIFESAGSTYEVKRENGPITILKNGLLDTQHVRKTSYQYLETLVGTYKEFEMITFQRAETRLFTNMTEPKQCAYII